MPIIKTFIYIESLNISSNRITETVAEDLASVVMSNNRLSTLTLSGCKLKNKTVKILRALQVVSSITVLFLGYMDMSDGVVTDLVLAINNNPLLKNLWLCSNKLSSSLVEIMHTCKRSAKYLITLNVEWNSVDPSTITNLVQTIGTINTLEALFVGGLTVTIDEKYIYLYNLLLYLEKLCSHPNMQI